MTLPKWIDENRNDIAYIDKVEKALSIAWQALDHAVEKHSCDQATDAIRRIEEIGK